jgi:putative oxidoreductase
MIRNKYILLFFRFVVGGVFIWAGLLKIFDPLGFAQSISNYKAFPQSFSFFIALVLPWIELICGILLIFGIIHRASALLLSGLLIIFLVLSFVVILRGLDIDCGCLGSLSRKVDYKLLLMDSIMLFSSIAIVSHKKIYESRD